MKQLSSTLLTLVLVASGCKTSPPTDPHDGGPADAATDAGALDAAPSADGQRAMDSAVPDAGKPDAGSNDADLNVDALPCPPTSYAAYFAANSSVIVASYGRLSPAGQAYFCDDLYQLEANGRITIAEPAASAGCVEPTSCTYITPTADEKDQILAAKYAHALWLDRNAKVPWKLASYSSAALDGLFNPGMLFRSGTHYMSVVDHSPTDAWAYLVARKLVRADVKSSMVAVLDDLRTTDVQSEFVHGISSADPVDTAYTVDEALRTRVAKTGGVTVRVSRKGCHSMTRIVLALLRAMNIPGEELHAGSWYGAGHSTARWAWLGLVIPHGDDLYQATLRATPSAALLIPESFYSAVPHTVVCGTDRSCLGRRSASLNAITHPAKYLKQRCCDPTKFGYTTCNAYLTKDYQLTLSSAEIASAAASIKASCP